MKTVPLNTLCMLRITPKTTDKAVKQFLHYLFDGDHEEEMEKEILELIQTFRDDKCSGRLSYNIQTGILNLKEDLPK